MTFSTVNLGAIWYINGTSNFWKISDKKLNAEKMKIKKLVYGSYFQHKKIAFFLHFMP